MYKAVKIHILTEISTDIGQKIILTEILTDFGQNLSPTCLFKDHVCNFLTEQSVKIPSKNLILTEIVGQNSSNVRFWPISVKIFPNTCLPTGSCLHFFDRIVGQNSVTNVILTEIVGQNFGQIIILTDFRSKFRPQPNFDQLSGSRNFGHNFVTARSQWNFDARFSDRQ